MVKAIKGLIETLKEGNDRDRDTLLQARQQDEEDLKICINLAVDYGATKDTNEFLMATEMFAKKNNRTLFIFIVIQVVEVVEVVEEEVPEEQYVIQVVVDYVYCV
jgi:predicted kinase